jgi:hypothetical protein
MQQNIWSMDKDISIKHLLLMLVEYFGDDAFAIDSERQNHPQSICLFKPDCREIQAYLYTYGQSEEHYGVHLEFPAIANNQRFDNTEIYEDTSLDNLIAILAVHFDIPQVTPFSQNRM